MLLSQTEYIWFNVNYNYQLSDDIVDTRHAYVRKILIDFCDFYLDDIQRPRRAK